MSQDFSAVSVQEQVHLATLARLQRELEAACREWQETRRRFGDLTERLRALHALSEEVSACPDQDSVVAVLTQSLEKQLNLPLFGFWLLGPGDGCVACHFGAACGNREQCCHLAACGGNAAHLDEWYQRVPLGLTSVGQVAARGALLSRTLVVSPERGVGENGTSGPDYKPEGDWARREGMGHFYGCPLFVVSPERGAGLVASPERGVAENGTFGPDYKRILGVLGVFSQHPLPPELQDVLALFSQHAAQAIHHAQTFERLNRTARELRLLYEASQKINQTLSLAEILQSLVDLGAAVAQCSQAVLLEYDEKNQQIVPRAAIGFRAASVEHLIFQPGEGAVGRMVSSGEPLIVTDLWPDNGFWPQEAEGEKVHSLMGIPIQVEGKVFGVFLVSSDRPCAFTEPDQQLLMTLANLAATAIRRARLYETLQQHSAELERANVELRESREQCEVSYRQLLATQAQLIQAEKMSTLGHLAAGIAHEIKTPLTGIQGAVEVLREDFAEQQDPRGAILEDVVRQISRLDQSVADFLRFARPARLQLQWTSVNDVVDSVCSLLQTQAGRYHAHLLKEYTDDAIAGWLDPDQIRQVLLNIGVNALEALGDAGGQVVFTTARHPDGANLVITVSDTGNGMPPDVLAQAFAPYFTTKSTGTGLGLAIAQRIMVEHGGTIAVESEVEQGTRFTLTLPVTRDGLTGEA